MIKRIFFLVSIFIFSFILPGAYPQDLFGGFDEETTLVVGEVSVFKAAYLQRGHRGVSGGR